MISAGRSSYWRNKTPPNGSSIDFSHPLSNRMSSCIVANQSAGSTFDLVGRTISSKQGVWGVGIRGSTVKGFSYGSNQTAYLDWTSGAFTVAAWGFLNATIPNAEYPNLWDRLSYTNETVNRGWALYISPPNDTNRFSYAVDRDNGVSNYRLNSATIPAVGEWFMVGASDGATIRRLYINGVEENSTANNLTPLSNTSTGLENATGATSSFPLYVGYTWNRLLSPSEIRWLYDEPYVFILPPSTRRYFFYGISSAAPSTSRLLTLTGVGT